MQSLHVLIFLFTGRANERDGGKTERANHVEERRVGRQKVDFAGSLLSRSLNFVGFLF